MPLKLNTILDLKNTYDTFLFDVWGVLWDGEEFYPGVIDTLATLKQNGCKIGIISNSTLIAPQLEAKFSKFGLRAGKHFDDMFTSGSYLQHLIKQDFFKNIFGSDYTFYCYGQRNEELFVPWAPHERNTLAEADFVYLGALTDKMTPIQENGETQTILADCLRLKKPLICANPDICATKKGQIYYTQGAIANAYEQMGGKVYWMGKPYPEIFDFACQIFGANKKTSIMVGDSVHTDIVGATRAGIDSVLIYETGILAHLTETERQQEMKKEGVYPTYTLGKVALSKAAISTQFPIKQDRSKKGN